MKKMHAHKWKIFNKNAARRAVGVPFAGMAIALSLLTYPTHAFEYTSAQGPQASAAQVVFTTKTQYQFPLEATLGMSQGYYGLHRGVDLRAPKGTAVYAIDRGTVVEVEEMRVGYGHFVRIAHDGTVSSLYAHLDQVKVEPGEKIEGGAIIGTVGMTGWTTGPHLHLEVQVGEKSVNPRGYISENSENSENRKVSKSENQKSI